MAKDRKKELKRLELEIEMEFEEYYDEHILQADLPEKVCSVKNFSVEVAPIVTLHGLNGVEIGFETFLTVTVELISKDVQIVVSAENKALALICKELFENLMNELDEKFNKEEITKEAHDFAIGFNRGKEVE